MNTIELVPVSALMPQIESILSGLLPRLRELLPTAELFHIGATALPDAVTKGDVDVLVRVSPLQFPPAVAVLGRHFTVKQPQNWTATFASFGDDASYALPVGVQVVVVDSEADFLLFLHDHFRTNPAALHEYNRLKVRHAGEGAQKYWTAKDEFLASILATRPRS